MNAGRTVSKACILIAISSNLLLASSAKADIFKFGGKVYKATDLSVADQQALFDIESDEYNRRLLLAHQAALNVYFGDEAKKTGKSKSEVEAAVLNVAEPTDKQAADWFEQNKSRIPPGYTLDKVSGEIKTLLKDQAAKEKREALLAKLKADGKFVPLLKEPEAPVVSIDVKDLPTQGAAAAKVTIVEFADYQCPHCKTVAPTLEALVKKYPTQVKFVFADFPIRGVSSESVAQGAYCAGEQHKYWEFHDLAFEKQQELGSSDAPTNLAKSLKLDEVKFANCLKGAAAIARVTKSKAEGERIGIVGTPAIFINGRRVKSHDLVELEKSVKKSLGK
ncbi:MAG: thioredoxin domain-containing protein [Proteobacteria bacterium]|nr:thioredoxin domain-containing protein [Pseudomonadota bacterium]